MLNFIIVILFIAQILGASALLGMAIRDSRQYKVPFGRNFINEKQQIIVMLWLICSLFANVCFAATMLD